MTALVLLFIAVFTPVEVAFMEPARNTSDPLFILGRAIEVWR